ncbi:prefoldin subunit 1 isoform X2 [Tachypleus tridentatus]|uniref:prefoldin subunit 1 isoform X2 n=1 Tax=Tachypleus tridentatus TaxID=6853 RepID=UPI003FD60D9E
MASIPVDLELKKAFQELQTKMIETTQKLKMSDIQIESLKKTIQHAKLTDSEILSLPADTRMYQGLGRTFLLTTPQDIKKDIEEKIKTSDEKIKNLESNKVYLEKSLKESEDNLREMIAQKQKGH